MSSAIARIALLTPLGDINPSIGILLHSQGYLLSFANFSIRSDAEAAGANINTSVTFVPCPTPLLHAQPGGAIGTGLVPHPPAEAERYQESPSHEDSQSLSIECKSLEDGFNSIHSVDLTCAGKEYNFPNNKKLSTRGSPSPRTNRGDHKGSLPMQLEFWL